MHNTHLCYYIITNAVILHATAHSHVLTSKTLYRTRNTRRTVHIVTLIRYFGFGTKFPNAFSLWIVALARRVCLLPQLLFNVQSEMTENFAQLLVISCVLTAWSKRKLSLVLVHKLGHFTFCKHNARFFAKTFSSTISFLGSLFLTMVGAQLSVLLQMIRQVPLLWWQMTT